MITRTGLRSSVRSLAYPCILSRDSQPGSMMSVLIRNNVKCRGNGQRPMLFAHGFGCDQNMWRYVAPAFEDDFRTILFDHVGAGGSDLSAPMRPQKYASLQGYADDVLDICRALDLEA